MLLLLHLLNLPPHLQPPQSYSPLDETVYAIHKPRNVISAASDDRARSGSGRPSNRPTLTDVMVAAGVDPLPGHCGRLDAETSGLILVTSDTLLLRAVLNWPEVLDAHGGTPLTKRYSLLLAGRHEPLSPPLLTLGEPLQHQRGGKAFSSNAAEAVDHRRCFVDEDIASGEHALIDRKDDDVETARARLRQQRAKPRFSRKTGERVPPYVPQDGWLTNVDLVLSQGRHHQVRRLVRRADLKLLHLRREAVGPVCLGEMAPGDVRVLDRAAKRELYAHCLPRLLDGDVVA